MTRTLSIESPVAEKGDIEDRIYAELRRHLKEEHAAMYRFAQPEWARLASSFRLRVARLARNPILERYLTELMSRCSLIVALYEPPGNAACEHDEHAEVVEPLHEATPTRPCASWKTTC